VATATTTRTAEQIQRDVQDELRWDARLQPNEIGVIVKYGVVMLTGWVDSYVKKWAAERAAVRVAGVRAVANDIEVKLPASAERTDADIAAAAVMALQWDALIPDEQVKVRVSEGRVTLGGEVEWQYQKRAAERAVRGLTGVRAVTNLISIRPRTLPSPEELKREISAALVRNVEIDAQRMTVDVVDDRVILGGTVRSWAERREADQAAWSAPGVTDVVNNIVAAP
jgi:osmotically-inducible protein OsmY